VYSTERPSQPLQTDKIGQDVTDPSAPSMQNRYSLVLGGSSAVERAERIARAFLASGRARPALSERISFLMLDPVHRKPWRTSPSTVAASPGG